MVFPLELTSGLPAEKRYAIALGGSRNGSDGNAVTQYLLGKIIALQR